MDPVSSQQASCVATEVIVALQLITVMCDCITNHRDSRAFLPLPAVLQHPGKANPPVPPLQQEKNPADG